MVSAMWNALQVAKLADDVRKQYSQARSCQIRRSSRANAKIQMDYYGIYSTRSLQTLQELRFLAEFRCDTKQTARVLHRAHATGFAGPCPACASCHEGSGSIHSRSQAGRSRSSTCTRKARGIDPRQDSSRKAVAEDPDVRMNPRNSLR